MCLCSRNAGGRGSSLQRNRYFQSEEVIKGGIASRSGVWDTSIPVMFLMSQKHVDLGSGSCVNSTSVKRGEKCILVFLVWAST